MVSLSLNPEYKTKVKAPEFEKENKLPVPQAITRVLKNKLQQKRPFPK